METKYVNEKSRSDYDRLLLLIRDGDREALCMLYEETAAKVYGYALSILKNTQDAEEVMQEVYLAVWNRADRYCPDGKPMAWIFTITKNLCYMKLRRQSYWNGISLEAMQEQESGWEPGKLCDAIESAPEKQVLLEALRSLSQEERSLVLLHDAGGMKHREIAESLGIPLATVLSRYRRALRKLCEKIEKSD